MLQKTNRRRLQPQQVVDLKREVVRSRARQSREDYRTYCSGFFYFFLFPQSGMEITLTIGLLA